MNVKPVPQYEQPLLLEVMPDKEFTSPASARTHYGRVAEEIAVAMLGATDIVNSGTYDQVYDASLEGVFLEVKNVHASGAVPIYVWRRAKDREAVKLGHLLAYVFTIHRVEKARSFPELWKGMSRHLEEIRIVPFHVINRACQGLNVVKNSGFVKGSRNGYERAGYCEGYQLLSVKTIRRMHYAPAFHVTKEIYGMEFSVPLFFHQSFERGSK